MTTYASFLAIHAVLAALATAFMGARVYAKRMKRLRWMLDDSVLLGALAFMYLTFAGSLVTIIVGKLGQPMSTLSLNDVEFTLKMLWLLQFPQAIALTLVRWAIVTFFIRTFFTKMFPKLRFVAYCCLFLSFIWPLCTIVVLLVHCRPIRYTWRLPLENPDYCFPVKPYTLFSVSFGLVLDGTIWSLPHFVVWKLQLRRTHKIATTAIFALGLLNIFVAIARIITLQLVDAGADVTHNTVSAVACAYAQISTAIILACCPLLRPLFEKMVPARLIRLGSPKIPRPNRILLCRNTSDIRRTTKINVHNDSREPHSYQAAISDRSMESRGPTFHVEMGEKSERRSCSPCP